VRELPEDTLRGSVKPNVTASTLPGIRTVREAGPRLDGLKSTLRELGGQVQSFYLTTGPHDTVAVVTLPDDATMARLALSRLRRRRAHADHAGVPGARVSGNSCVAVSGGRDVHYDG
jgi:GYD domain